MKKIIALVLALILIFANVVIWLAWNRSRDAEDALRAKELQRFAADQAMEDIENKCPKYFITGTVPVFYSQRIEEEFKDINLKCSGNACLSSSVEHDFGAEYNEQIEKWYLKEFGEDFEVRREKAWNKSLKW